MVIFDLFWLFLAKISKITWKKKNHPWLILKLPPPPFPHLLDKKLTTGTPAFSAIIDIACCTCCGLPRTTNTFSFAFGPGFLCNSTCAPDCPLIWRIVSPPVNDFFLHFSVSWQQDVGTQRSTFGMFQSLNYLWTDKSGLGCTNLN